MAQKLTDEDVQAIAAAVVDHLAARLTGGVVNSGASPSTGVEDEPDDLHTKTLPQLKKLLIARGYDDDDALKKEKSRSKLEDALRLDGYPNPPTDEEDPEPESEEGEDETGEEEGDGDEETYTREEVESWSLAEQKQYAKDCGLKLKPRQKQDSIIDDIMAYLGEEAEDESGDEEGGAEEGTVEYYVENYDRDGLLELLSTEGWDTKSIGDDYDEEALAELIVNGE